MFKIFRWFGLGLYTIVTIIPYYLYVGFTCIINPEKGKELKYKGKPIIPIMMLALTLAVYFICIFTLSRWYVQRLKIKYLANDIIESTKILESDPVEEIVPDEYTPTNENNYAGVSYINVDFNELLKKNSDTVAWIKVNNTNVNYSVVQADDNEYYLHHDFNKYNNMGGWIFADYRDDFEYFGTNTIIYGHNLTNRTMFGSLIWCEKPSWYKKEENQYIKLSTPTSNTIWKIFSIYEIKPEVEYLKTYFESDEEHQALLDKLKNRSIYNFGENLTTDDKILTLSTCSDDGLRRAVIHAKLVKVEYRDKNTSN
ncbi:MAG: class B sortase [Bacilli bacterium]|nr:class B sortase [Bacilli bacterium]